MKLIYVIVLLVLSLFSSCSDKQTHLYLVINNCQGEEIRLSNFLCDTILRLDPKGEAKIALNLECPMFFDVQMLKNKQRIYLEPGQNVEIYLEKRDVEVGGKKACFLDWVDSRGDLADENIYLNSSVKYAQLNRNELDAESSVVNLHKYEDLLEKNYQIIASKGLSDNFERLERERIKYQLYQQLLTDSYKYPDFIELVKQVVHEDASLLFMEEYRGFLTRLIKFVALTSGDWNDSLGELRGLLGIVNTYFSDPTIVSFLVDSYVMPYVSINGYEGAEDIRDLYLNNVTDMKKIARFKKICADFEKIGRGQPCPAFTFKDVQGNVITLEDLKGKYVYMDIWSTRCAPCVKQIPYLNKLEEKFKDKEIYFVSLSFDEERDMDAWRNMIKDKDMKGIQLHVGDDREWLHLVMPCLITGPRFMLLDKNGCFIKAFMNRPSDPVTEEMLNMLLK